MDFRDPLPLALARGSDMIRLVAAFALAVWAPLAPAQNTVPSQFHGTWVSAGGSCDAPLRVVVSASKLTLVNRGDHQELGEIEMAGPGYFPPDYRGIMAVLITEFSGQQPATVTFNVGEKKGAAQVEFSPVMPGRPNAQLSAYNARITKLNLAKRFPIDKAMLRKCS